MRWSVTVPPEVEPVSLKEVKLYLRVDHDLDNSVIDTLIKAMRHRIESSIRRCLITQQIQMRGIFPLSLVRQPLQHIIDVTQDGHLLTKKDYQVEETGTQVRIILSSPRYKQCGDAGGQVTYQAGYGDKPSHVPAPVRLALLYLIHQYYNTRLNPHDLTNLPLCEGAHFLLAPFCVTEV